MFGRPHQVVAVVAAAFVEDGRVVFVKQPGEAVDPYGGALEIVGHGVGENLQLLGAGFQGVLGAPPLLDLHLEVGHRFGQRLRPFRHPHLEVVPGLLERLFGPFPLRDVDRDAHHAGKHAVRIGEGPLVDEHVVVLAVRIGEGRLDGFAPGPVEQMDVQLVVPAGHFHRKDVEGGPPDDLLTVQPEAGFEGLVAPEVGPVGVFVEYGGGDGVDERLVEVELIEERVFHPHSLGSLDLEFSDPPAQVVQLHKEFFPGPFIVVHSS